MNNEKHCVSDGKVYLSWPTQSRCVHCGKYWFSRDPAPVCPAEEDKKALDEPLREHASFLSLEKGDIENWRVVYLPKHGGDWTHEYDNSCANVLAKMLIYLVKNGLLDPKKLG